MKLFEQKKFLSNCSKQLVTPVNLTRKKFHKLFNFQDWERTPKAKKLPFKEVISAAIVVSYTWYKSLMKLMLDNGLMSLARLFHFYKCIAKYHRNLEVNFWVNVRFADWNFSLELLTCVLLYDSLPERQCNENFNLVQLF